jgi:hypothetical protein
VKCAGEDLNLHAPKGTRPSTLRVYQFRHQRAAAILAAETEARHQRGLSGEGPLGKGPYLGEQTVEHNRVRKEKDSYGDGQTSQVPFHDVRSTLGRRRESHAA